MFVVFAILGRPPIEDTLGRTMVLEVVAEVAGVLAAVVRFGATAAVVVGVGATTAAAGGGATTGAGGAAVVAAAALEVVGGTTGPCGRSGGVELLAPCSTHSIKCGGNSLKCGMLPMCWQYCG